MTWNPDALLYYRKEIAGMSLRVAAQHLGVTFGAIGAWERGEKHPMAERLGDIAELYGCEVNDFFAPVPEDEEPAKPISVSCLTHVS